MELSKYDLLIINDKVTDNIVRMQSSLHWDIHRELTEEERLAVAWIEAINSYVKGEININYKKEVRYDN